MAGKRSRATYEADLQAIQSPYVFYGTPLPPLDPNVRDDGSFVPIWKQEVTDERGRKRLHGAFTGGFSAGYFNTVGSKEGWTPATFVSSKTNRWKDSGKKSQNVEDIMDEEDKAEAEEARHISTQSGYAGLGSTEDEVNRRAPLMDLFRPSNDTMGFNLLRRMGWKDGQGIGPRVLREAALNDGSSFGKKGTEKHLFAPKNSKLILIIRKTDRKGLGYNDEGGGLSKPAGRSPDRSGDEETFAAKSRKQPLERGGFGVGALNDTGSDDEDPFSLGPKISYSKVMGGDKKKKKKSNIQPGSNSNPLLSKRPVFVSVKANKALSGFRKCHDGRLPLEGFILSVSKPLAETNKYPPPKVPDDWKSSKSAGSSVEQPMEWQSSADLAKSSILQPAARGAILGEAPLPSKSVFDFIKPEGRARLVSLTRNEALPPARSESAPQESFPDQALEIPALDASIASSALGRGVGGFIPYTDDAEKLARYRAYLSYNAGITTEIPVRPPKSTKDEWIREMQEFVHAATIFKPMTGSIATRFASASAASLQPRDSDTAEDGEKDELQKLAKDPAEEAAAMSMFGHLTRSSQFFYPSRLLCKRFNVPVPSHVHSGNEGSRSVPRANQTAPTEPAQSSVPSASSAPRDTPMISSRFQSSGYQIADDQEPVAEANRGGAVDDAQTPRAAQKPGTTLSSVEVDPERNEALEKDRPGDDVFRAIFGSDSEDD